MATARSSSPAGHTGPAHDTADGTAEETPAETARVERAPRGTRSARASADRPTQTPRKATATMTVTEKTAAPAATPTAEVAPQLVVLEQESPWTPAELGEVREQLLADVERLRGELAEVEGDLAGMIENPGEGSGHDQADVGSASFERDQERQIVNNARDMLEQSQHALERIDVGTYGQCETCGQPIGKNRLMAFPRATLCLRCKQREERR